MRVDFVTRPVAEDEARTAEITRLRAALQDISNTRCSQLDGDPETCIESGMPPFCTSCRAKQALKGTP